MSKKSCAESSELKTREVEVKNFRKELSSMVYDEVADTQNRETLASYQQEIHQMQIKLNILHQKNPRIHFTYKDPFVGFNRDDVRGCIATLFRIKDPKYALALEIAAGSFYEPTDPGGMEGLAGLGENRTAPTGVENSSALLPHSDGVVPFVHFFV
ncbi:unnamed protein product [Heligmosomoides polygyrus]|uniref:LCIB_C_CA domain-containing protein n=1 Tax=Heligmosomoides polygyrus TaxID=6339 RepID=A0A183GF30_HELPZ|nr:unnamed protein product [Heligmosomoides polygyrus]